jgi:glycosyltransferase involved in cell wall biosynthesis
MRKVYETNHNAWMKRMKEIVPKVFPVTPYSLKDTMPKEEELPDVSIVCVTRNRRLFMPVLKYSYMIQSYPEDKLELVVVDDGDDPIEDTLIGVPNVKYVRVDTQLSIGEKRNIGVQNAMYDVIAFMDDDDVYPNNSILHRAAMLMKEPKKECGFCTTIPCYDITKYSSFMNVPPITLEMSERVSEATLIFTRKFWEERKFDHIQIAEGNTFIRGREHMCRELSPQDVIVSLVHPKNTSSRKIPEMKEPNGCHYGFNENLFAMVSQIGLEMKNA